MKQQQETVAFKVSGRAERQSNDCGHAVKVRATTKNGKPAVEIRVTFGRHKWSVADVQWLVTELTEWLADVNWAAPA